MQQMFSMQNRSLNNNFFANSLSAVNYGNWSVKDSGSSSVVKPFTNVMSIVGDFSAEIVERLSTMQHPTFRPSYVFQRQSADCVYFKSNLLPHKETVFRSSGVASIGTNQFIGNHMENLAGSWNIGYKALSAQFEKVGMNEEDANEIKERLLTIGNKYKSS